MEKKAVGRSIFISACKKSSVSVLREQSEQYPIFPSYKEEKMADRIKGITIEIDGNTTKLSEALKKANAQT